MLLLLVVSLYLTLCNPMDHSPPGSSVHGILQARILQWAANGFSNFCVKVSVWVCPKFCMEHTYINIKYVVVCLKSESGHPKIHVATLLPRTSLILPSLDKITIFHWVLLLHVMKPVNFRRWILLFKIGERGISSAFQWLGLSSSTSGSMGSISGQGTKILHATWHGQKINKLGEIKATCV